MAWHASCRSTWEVCTSASVSGSRTISLTAHSSTTCWLQQAQFEAAQQAEYLSPQPGPGHVNSTLAFDCRATTSLSRDFARRIGKGGAEMVQLTSRSCTPGGRVVSDLTRGWGSRQAVAWTSVVVTRPKVGRRIILASVSPDVREHGSGAGTGRSAVAGQARNSTLDGAFPKWYHGATEP
jgi:hypothetical protein